jgi:hypothetical protein
VNGFALQLVRQIVPMQLSHGKESRLACVSHCFAGTRLHRRVAFLPAIAPDIPTGGAPLGSPHEPASSNPEPDYQAEDDQ